MKKTAYITIRTNEHTKTILEKKAQKEDRTLSYIIDKILVEYAKREEDKNMYEDLYKNIIVMLNAAEEIDHIIDIEQKNKLLKMLYEIKESMDEELK